MKHDSGTALYGGTFNPVHAAHLVIAEWVRDELSIERVVFVPTAHPPHRLDDPSLIDIRHRREMLRLAIQGNPAFSIADYESDSGAVSYTIDTVRRFLDDVPETHGKLHYIVGEDNFRAIRTWKNYGELSRLARIVVASRRTDTPVSGTEDLADPVFVESPRMDISASMIRERIAAGRSIKHLVPTKVERYIREHNLYSAVS